MVKDISLSLLVPHSSLEGNSVKLNQLFFRAQTKVCNYMEVLIKYPCNTSVFYVLVSQIKLLVTALCALAVKCSIVQQQQCPTERERGRAQTLHSGERWEAMMLCNHIGTSGNRISNTIKTSYDR